MGLIKLEGNNSIISCELYRLYFGEKNIKTRINNALYLEKLEQENEKLQSLVYFDPLTEIANRRNFDDYFEKAWKRMEELAEPISLILSDIDYFKIYNDTYGHQKGDDCLRQIAQAICQIIGRPENLVARYGGEEFVIVLPRTDTTEAINIAEKVRKNIEKIAIPFKSQKFSGLPNSVVTISLGVACTIPQAHNPENLLLEADRALYQSKRKGRNCTTISSVLNFRF